MAQGLLCFPDKPISGGVHLSPSIETEFTLAVQNAWLGQLELGQVVEVANRIEAQGYGGLAAVLYQTWLQRSGGNGAHFINFNLGVTLFNQRDFLGAKSAYETAIRLAPNFIQPRFNLGVVHEHLGQIGTAIEQWRWITQHVRHDNQADRPLLISTLNNLGRVLEGQKQYHEALQYLTTSLTLSPEQPDALHHWVYLREKQCAWPVYQTIPGVSPELMRQSTSALATLSLSDDPESQLQAALNYAERKIPRDLPQLAPKSAYGHRKIRIAYCSSDFCLHPVALLTAELFELHDREQFEVYGYCWTKDDGSAIRQRIINAMDRFHRIDQLDDASAARLIREHEIDILIDLHGQTKGARTTLLAYRPAPIQITYLGLPATTGLPCVDYVIADRFLIPEEHARFYSEKPLYMPDVYQVSDRKRATNPPPTRAECGLPEDAFVFCSFNNNYKFTPEVFARWMSILNRVPDSVLWLLSDNPWAEANLRNVAAAAGVDPRRLIFAGRVSPENYLGRFGVPDLFLDSFPFNAGTTANDALWMGLPVLTLTGRSFASRMAGALLTAAGLPELITYSLDDYEEKAVALAQDRQRCADLKAQLGEVRRNGVLFDTPRFVRNLEARLQQLLGEIQPKQ